MDRTRYHLLVSDLFSRAHLLILALIVGNFIFTIVSNASFKLSAQSSNLRGFITWQVVGNLAGFVTVIMLTWMLKYIPLSVAFPLTSGLGVIGVQFIASHWFFGEVIPWQHWLGAILVIFGIVFLSK